MLTMARLMRRSRHQLVCLLLILSEAVFISRACAGIQYIVSDLGNGEAKAINNFGQILIYTNGRSYLYSNGSITDIGTLGGNGTVALAINNSGQIVGESKDTAGIYRAFLYEDNKMTMIGPSLYGGTSAVGINDSGVIAVSTLYSGPSFYNPAFLYYRGTIKYLGSFEPQAINSQGVLIGSSYEVGDAIVQGIDGKIQNLEASTEISAVSLSDLNNAGQVVGNGWVQSSTGTTMLRHAFIYSNNNVKDIGTLSGSNGTNTYALGINNLGQVVGASITKTGSQHAVIYVNNNMFDLSDASLNKNGLSIQWAEAVNDNGQIVGFGYKSSEQHAFLLTPTILTQAVNRTPTSSLTNVSNSGFSILQTFNPSLGFVLPNKTAASVGFINPDLPTVVLTHGFGSDVGMWNQFAKDYPGAGITINVIAFDWSQDAKGPVGKVASRTPHEGDILGQLLRLYLGVNYNEPIHFFGHSLGTMVNAEAVNIFDALPGSGAKTQVTIFDDAENANEFSPDSQYASSLPTVSVAHIDNYISAFGQIKQLPNVANILLNYYQSPLGIGPELHNDKMFHSYPPNWYQATLPQNSSNTTVGYAWAIDNPANTAINADGKYFTQLPSGDPLALKASQYSEVNELVNQRNKTYQEASISTYFSATTFVDSTIQTVGGVKALLVGPTLSPQFVLSGTKILTPQIRALLNETSSAVSSPTPAYAWMQIHIPNGTQTLSFDFIYNGVDLNDILMLGINDTQLFALEGAYVPDGTTENSGLLDIANWAGQDVELFIGSTGISSSGTMVIENFAFQIVPEPSSVGLMMLGMLLLFRKL